ncbi:MAG: transcription-repair coupling factor [Alphaproteobacteria bacterium]|nr:transcription-repair coupling factor [Alphaproteobacteria bacterium]
MAVSQGFLQDAARLRAQGVGWAELPPDALAFVLARLDPAERTVVVVDEPDAAERLARALRFFADEPGRVETFPADDVRPYDGFSPSPDVVAQRTRTLHRWGRGDPLIVVAPVRALLQRVPTAAVRAAGTLTLEVGARLDRDELVAELTTTGYLAAARAEHPGTFAVRGDVVDVWSAGLPAPRRIDFFDDEIEEIRRLDPRTLRATGRAARATVLPAREERVDDEAVARFAAELGRLAAAQGRGLTLRRRLVEELRAGIRFSAVEDHLPALVPTTAPLDLLEGGRSVVVQPRAVLASARDTLDTVARRWRELDGDERPLVPPDERFLPLDHVERWIRDAHPVFDLSGSEASRPLGAEPVEGLAVRGTDLGPTVSRLRKLADAEARIALVAPSTRRAELLHDLLDGHGVVLVGRAAIEDLRPGEISVLVGDLPRGFLAPRSGWAFVPTHALFGAQDAATRRRAHDLFEAAVGAVTDLKSGDLVVHRLHGIGRYDRLDRLDVDGAQQDFVRILYRGDDVLYVPVTSLDQLSAYTASRHGVEVRLDRLGGQTWAARKDKVRDSLLSAAQELLAVQARRELAERPAHPPPGELYQQLVARFPHTETPDQARAILDVQEDLSSDAPMDRLLCGDVGFGKTEVALRAAMRVIEGGQQVAVLCPTTVLAFQHHLKLTDRFADLPVRVAMLSRFTPAAEERRVLEGLRTGEIDLVVGTHTLLGRSVRFARLGLVVVDEEHRFGVRQKERFKKLRASVDLLSMSATPIPRTLQQAVSGLRTMSVMATPPGDRLEVRTSVARMTQARISDAIRLELERKGQVFFVHNRVESIERVAERLRGWVPEARIEVAHGQMPAERIERLLVDFMEHRCDVLVCTAIVESGVDLPNVNTMIIDRADQFGLAQLYQLRGRVGRSSVRGSCLLLAPEELARDARRRLQVLVENTRLGSGFAVAAADLELRGGGNLLGEDQSGNIDAVGYQVWVELLEEAVDHARGAQERDHLEPEVEIGVPAFLPESLVPDMTERLAWYRRLSGALRPDETEPILDELQHERGPLPVEVHNLAGKIEIAAWCRRVGLARVGWLKVRALLELHPRSALGPAALEQIVAEHPRRMSLERTPDGAPVLAVRFTPSEAERPFVFLRWVLARLARELPAAGR